METHETNKYTSDPSRFINTIGRAESEQIWLFSNRLTVRFHNFLLRIYYTGKSINKQLESGQTKVLLLKWHIDSEDISWLLLKWRYLDQNGFKNSQQPDFMFLFSYLLEG